VICPSGANWLDFTACSSLERPIIGRFRPRGKTNFANSSNIFRLFKVSAENKSLSQNQKM
jgi:hypothetical protein